MESFMIGLIFSLVSMSHAVPLQMTQQGRLLDTSGAAITGTHDLTFRIYDDQSAGFSIVVEVLTVQFNNGYFATVLGSDEINNPLDSTTLEFFPLSWNSKSIKLSTRSQNRIDLSALRANVRRNRIFDGWFSRGEHHRVQNGGNQIQVIDASGNWVGPAMAVDWNNIDQRLYLQIWQMVMTTPNCLKAMWKPVTPMVLSLLPLALRFKVAASF